VGRALTFADPKIIDLAQNNFIAVAADDWYQRRRQDDEGEFFRKIADQGPRKGEGGSTRQGIYVFSAGGAFLGYRNHQDPAIMRQFLLESLKAWQRLPARERVPKAVEVGAAGKIDRQYQRELPVGGAIIHVYTRILDRDADGEYCHGSCKFPGGDKAAHDHLWLLPEDITALLPSAVKQGDRCDVPQRLAFRIARFHLVDNTRGEPPFWRRDQVRQGKLEAIVQEANGAELTLKIEGSFELANQAESDKSERGYDVRLVGTIRGDRAAKKIERFDLVALGMHWGSGPYTGGARPGRAPLGVAFELSRGVAAADRVPPQAAREWDAYMRAER
jgi:hypothetical protein